VSFETIIFEQTNFTTIRSLMMNNTKKVLLVPTLLLCSAISSPNALAGYEIKLGEADKITFGGFIQGDIRYVDGDAHSPVFNDEVWIGVVSKEDVSNVRFSANTTRFNTKYVSGDITGFIEMDFLLGGGNEKLTSSEHPRLRHAFIKYKNWTIGQTWSTYVNPSSFVESANLGGPLIASAFIRQSMVRYTMGGFQIAIENPESLGGGAVPGANHGTQDAIPDIIGKYTFKGKWGNVAIAGVAKQLESKLGNSESGFGYGITGRIKAYGKDDIRFQFHGGETGRYVGAGMSPDLAGEKVEDTTSIMVAYRHWWNETTRTNVFYGNGQSDISDRDRTHWGINVFRNITKKLSYGVEFGNFEAEDIDADSNYAQLNIKYVL
jgi:hypothetical protein